MNWMTTLTTLLILFGYPTLVLAETGEALPAATGKPLVTFDLDEYFRGEKELPRAIHLEVDEQGNYLATYHLISDDANLNKHHEDRGQLDGETLQYIRDWLGIIKFESLPSDGKALNIGYGQSLTPGWKGKLAVVGPNGPTTIAFTSLRPESFPQRERALNQLVTFTFDLKRLTLGKFNMNRPRAVPSDGDEPATP